MPQLSYVLVQLALFVATSFATARVGFINDGAVCYQNAVLQNVIRSRHIREWSAEASRKGMTGLVNDALLGLVRRGEQPQTTQQLHSLALRQAMSQAEGTSEWVNGQAQDSAQFLVALVADVGSEFQDHFTIKISGNGTCTACTAVTPIPTDIATALVLPIPKTGQTHQLQDLIAAAYTHGTYPRRCETCDQVSESLVDIAFESLPKVLVVHINRLTFDQGVINDEVSLPDELKLTSSEQGEVTYALMGSVEHTGGHFRAHVKENDEWTTYDDSSVRPGAKDSRPYLAFYEMQ